MNKTEYVGNARGQRDNNQESGHVDQIQTR